MNFFEPHSYINLKDAANSILTMLSEFIGTNSFCVTKTNDQMNSFLLHVFNRTDVLFESGVQLNLEDAY